MTVPIRAYIGLGSNLQMPVQQIWRALDALKQMPRTVLAGHSSLYRSKPLEGMPQPDFINAVAALDTGLDAPELLAELQAIEQRQGRVRDGQRWAPRTLDLDLLLYGEERIVTEQLTVPHPGLLERSFVLIPLLEIAPELRLASGEQLAERAAMFPDDLQRLDFSAGGLGIY